MSEVCPEARAPGLSKTCHTWSLSLRPPLLPKSSCAYEALILTSTTFSPVSQLRGQQDWCFQASPPCPQPMSAASRPQALTLHLARGGPRVPLRNDGLLARQCSLAPCLGQVVSGQMGSGRKRPSGYAGTGQGPLCGPSCLIQGGRSPGHILWTPGTEHTGEWAARRRHPQRC